MGGEGRDGKGKYVADGQRRPGPPRKGVSDHVFARVLLSSPATVVRQSLSTVSHRRSYGYLRTHDSSVLYSLQATMNPLALVHRQLRHSFARTPRCWQRQSLPFAAAPSASSRPLYRAFSQRHTEPPSDVPKPKPKASTPLRRAASASLPIRSNPTPTRSDIHPIFTYASAERYLMPSLRAALPAGSQLLHDAWWVPRWTDKVSGKEGEVFVFGNGSFVCWGLGEEEAERFKEHILSRCGAEVAPLKEVETEDLEFVTDPEE